MRRVYGGEILYQIETKPLNLKSHHIYFLILRT